MCSPKPLTLVIKIKIKSMSYLDKIIQCNTFNPEKYIPFVIEGETLGFPKISFANKLTKWEQVFKIKENKLYLDSALSTPNERTLACQPIIQDLYEKEVIDSWVDEYYSVVINYGEIPRFLIERAAVTFMGLRGFGIHINGLVKKNDGIYIWIARRTKDKPFWPGQLDQIVAGGQPAGIGRMENVVKEAAEEASIPTDLAMQSKPVSELHYRGETHRGMNVDTLFNYDLWLPEDFIPVNTDGEVDEFILMPIEEMARLTENTNEFKDNCDLVNIDLLIRLGLINETHPDYDEINKLLYQKNDYKK